MIIEGVTFHGKCGGLGFIGEKLDKVCPECMGSGMITGETEIEGDQYESN